MFQVDSPNSTENVTFNDICSLKTIEPFHCKHLYYSYSVVLTCCKWDI